VVEEGAPVVAGEILGYVGLTGKITGPHIHVHAGLTLKASSAAGFPEEYFADAGGRTDIITFGNPDGFSGGLYTYNYRASLEESISPTALQLVNGAATVTGSVGFGQGSSSWNTDDYFKFVAPSDGTLTARLAGLSADIDLQIFTADGRPLDESKESGTQNEVASTTVVGGQTYFVHVDPYQKAQSNYSLETSFQPSAGESSRLTPTYIGSIGASGIYRVDLAAVGLGSIQSIRVVDDNVISGGSGGASGFDLDFIGLSTKLLTSASDVASLAGLGVFDFGRGVTLAPGFMQPWQQGDSAAWNVSYLFGTTGMVFSPSKATLGVVDGSNDTDGGAVSLGEGGSVSFALTSAVSTQGLYLYFADAGGGNDGAYVIVASGKGQAPAAGVSLTGTAAGDDLRLGQGANAHLGAGNDTVNGAAGNDTISGGDGSNVLRGDEGNDQLSGGAAFDDINGNMGNDTASGGDGDDWVVGGKDNDQLIGDAGADIVYGNLGADVCLGGAGDDLIRGGQGDDVVDGGAGNDWLSGDLGSDNITGGLGADIFHTFATAGLDLVTDFNRSQGDRVQLDPGTQYALRQEGANTVIDMAGGNQMVLVNVQLSSLTGSWIFGA
jgi:Ca2+-binding RTX toxin-like protein